MAGAVKPRRATASAAVYLAGPSGTGLVGAARPRLRRRGRLHPSTLAGPRAEPPRVDGRRRQPRRRPLRRLQRRRRRRDVPRRLPAHLRSAAGADVGPGAWPRVVHRRRPGRRRRRLRRSGDGGGARLPGASPTRPTQLTFRPRASSCSTARASPSPATSTGAGGLPVTAPVQRPASATVTRRLSQASTAARRGADGLLQATLQPTANATWTAAAGGVAGEEALIQVMPRVTMALSHLKAGTRLTEIFSGSVQPERTRARRVLVQKAVGTGWRTVASGRLDSRSRYHITWCAALQDRHLQAAGGPARARATTPRALRPRRPSGWSIRKRLSDARARAARRTRRTGRRALRPAAPSEFSASAARSPTAPPACRRASPQLSTSSRELLGADGLVERQAHHGLLAP